MGKRGLENGVWCREEGCVKGTQSPTTGFPCILGVHGKNKLHAPRIAGAVAIKPCRDARGGFLFALYVLTEVLENYELIYWQKKKKCKHCIAEMAFASWIVCWCLLFNSFFCIHQNKSKWLNSPEGFHHTLKSKKLQKSIFSFKQKWWCFHENSSKEREQIALLVISSFQIHGSWSLQKAESLLLVDYHLVLCRIG